MSDLATKVESNAKQAFFPREECSRRGSGRSAEIGFALEKINAVAIPEAESAALKIRLDSEAILVVSELARVESSDRCI